MGLSRSADALTLNSAFSHAGQPTLAKDPANPTSCENNRPVPALGFGERWSKLVTNAMANGIAACTGLSSGEMLHNDPIRHFSWFERVDPLDDRQFCHGKMVQDRIERLPILLDAIASTSRPVAGDPSH